MDKARSAGLCFVAQRGLVPFVKSLSSKWDMPMHWIRAAGGAAGEASALSDRHRRKQTPSSHLGLLLLLLLLALQQLLQGQGLAGSHAGTQHRVNVKHQRPRLAAHITDRCRGSTTRAEHTRVATP